MSPEFYWIAVAAVLITSAARLTRLATWDEFPPVVWMRNKYADATDGTGWQLLAFCGYCASFWITGLVLAAAWACGVLDGTADDTASEWVWWIAGSVFGGSYLSAVLMAHDGDEGDD